MYGKKMYGKGRYEDHGDITFGGVDPKVILPGLWGISLLPYIREKSDITRTMGDTTFGGVDPKVISPNMSGMSLFPIHFFWMYGGIGIIRGF
jgi:hypothetical protein